MSESAVPDDPLRKISELRIALEQANRERLLIAIHDLGEVAAGRKRGHMYFQHDHPPQKTSDFYFLFDFKPLTDMPPEAPKGFDHIPLPIAPSHAVELAEAIRRENGFTED